MNEMISVLGTLLGVVVGFTLSFLLQRRNEKKKMKEIACSFKAELELNLRLIRLIREDIHDFEGSKARIVTDETHPFRVYNNLFNSLPDLGYGLFTQIKSFYDLTNIKYKQLVSHKDANYPGVIKTMGRLEPYIKIGTNWDEGWEELEKLVQEIIKKLNKICK